MSRTAAAEIHACVGDNNIGGVNGIEDKFFSIIGELPVDNTVAGAPFSEDIAVVVDGAGIFGFKNGDELRGQKGIIVNREFGKENIGAGIEKFFEPVMRGDGVAAAVENGMGLVHTGLEHTEDVFVPGSYLVAVNIAEAEPSDFFGGVGSVGADNETVSAEHFNFSVMEPADEGIAPYQAEGVDNISFGGVLGITDNGGIFAGRKFSQANGDTEKIDISFSASDCAAANIIA